MRQWAMFMSLVVACGCETKGEAVAPDEAHTEAGVASREATTGKAPKEDFAKAEPEAAVDPVPLQHASMLLKWNGLVLAVDPVKDALEAAQGDEPQADLILVTDIHGDHFDAEAVAKLRKEGAPVVVPKAVAEQGGEALPNPTILGNGEQTELLDGKVKVEGVAMYNLERKRDSGEPYHVKGRGNGYLLTLGDQRVYISGDTECIPEMKALQNIDVAFVCMNLPYTMTVEEAAGCIREFKPDVLYPYHFRGQDPAKLNELLAGTGVEVKMLQWYPAGQ